MLAGVKREGRKIMSIKVCNKAGVSEVSARIYVDATGDADLSRFAGIAYQKGRPKDGFGQPMTTNVKITNVDMDLVKQDMEAHPENFTMNPTTLHSAKRLSVAGYFKELEAARAAGEITFERESVLFFETPNHNEVILNMTRVIKLDATIPEQFSKAEMEGRRQAWEAFRFLKKRIPAFSDAIFMATGTQIGVRETGRILGRYLLTADDLLTGKEFPDAICRGGYPIDIHNPTGTNTTSYHMNDGASYTIPFRCLLPVEVDNLLVSGRAISSTHEAAAAIRVTPLAMTTGQAAGTAAALCATNSVPTGDLDVELLRRTLVLDGVTL